jgi:hypothetical protein
MLQRATRGLGELSLKFFAEVEGQATAEGDLSAKTFRAMLPTLLMGQIKCH